MSESAEITARLKEQAEWMHTLRVSQDGWAKVLDRIATDTADIVGALQAGKIVAHVPQHLKKGKTK